MTAYPSPYGSPSPTWAVRDLPNGCDEDDGLDPTVARLLAGSARRARRRVSQYAKIHHATAPALIAAPLGCL